MSKRFLIIFALSALGFGIGCSSDSDPVVANGNVTPTGTNVPTQCSTATNCIPGLPVGLPQGLTPQQVYYAGNNGDVNYRSNGYNLQNNFTVAAFQGVWNLSNADGVNGQSVVDDILDDYTNCDSLFNFCDDYADEVILRIEVDRLTTGAQGYVKVMPWGTVRTGFCYDFGLGTCPNTHQAAGLVVPYFATFQPSFRGMDFKVRGYLQNNGRYDTFLVVVKDTNSFDQATIDVDIYHGRNGQGETYVGSATLTRFL